MFMKRTSVKNVIIILFLTSVALLSAFTPAGEGVREYKLRRVVIDAGHGGKDPGTLGARSKEKDVALAIALKVGNYIKENIPDVEVIYTRKTDVFIPLEERANIANRNKADLFVSIHCNAVTGSNAYGTETYVMGDYDLKRNFEIVKRENSVILMEENYKENYEGFDPKSPESYMMFNLMQKAYFASSLSLAQKIQDDFKTRINRHSRGVKQLPLMVLWRSSMPSVLVETGFLSNSNEERYLNSENGQAYLASAIYRSIKAYKAEIEAY